jgi:hypothetical protein
MFLSPARFNTHGLYDSEMGDHARGHSVLGCAQLQSNREANGAKNDANLI